MAGRSLNWIIASDHFGVLEQDFGMSHRGPRFFQEFLGVYLWAVLGSVLHRSLEYQMGIKFVEPRSSDDHLPSRRVVMDAPSHECQLTVPVRSHPAAYDFELIFAIVYGRLVELQLGCP